jgi:hypothetical protein
LQPGQQGKLVVLAVALAVQPLQMPGQMLVQLEQLYCRHEFPQPVLSG